MNSLYVKMIRPEGKITLEKAGYLLEKETISSLINTVNWEEFPYTPKVNFRIGYAGDEIWLKYFVEENYVRALETRTNGEIYKDSCVEFFVSFDKKNYYNLEFSCIGTIHMAYGPGRANRTFVSPENIQSIKIYSTLGNQPFDEKQGQFAWELTVIIPAACFQFDKGLTFKGKKASANFYKCGDGTSKPHYLTWNPVKTANPDYHRPEFFGDIQFE